MVRISNIKNIELGYRQLIFGFEDNTEGDLKLVLECVNAEFGGSGQVMLEDFICHMRDQHGFAEFDTLQCLFWLVQELKLHFRLDHKILEPLGAKKILIESGVDQMEVVPNENVEDQLFSEVVLTYNALFQGKTKKFSDQYEFACQWLSDLTNLQFKFMEYKQIARKTSFPGSGEIDKCLTLIKILSIKKDSCSLILNLHGNRDEIINMVHSFDKLTLFYTKHKEFWELLIQSIKEFESSLPEIRENRAISTQFDELVEIFQSSSPYNLIAKAKKILENVQTFHGIQERQKIEAHRKKTLLKIDKMVEKLLKFLSSNKKDQHFSNKLLLSLRSIKKQVETAPAIDGMELLLDQAVDIFDEVL